MTQEEMNREIKFRGKSVSTGKWLYGYLAEDKFFSTYLSACEKVIFKNLEAFNTDNFSYVVNDCKVSENTIGQYTGLCDSNGKEIYEGDILKMSIAEDSIGVVKWNSKQAAFVIKMKNSSQWYYLHQSYQIIGNIFDNPNLIENEK